MKKEPKIKSITKEIDSKDDKKVQLQPTKCQKNTKEKLKYISKCCKNIEN